VNAIAALILLATMPGDVIPAAKAKEHVGKEGTFEMKVISSRNVERSKVYFLNSEEDYRNPDNLAIVIEYGHAQAFKEAGIDDPAAHYLGKSIRVTGKVLDERDQTRIRVTSPEQIEVVTPDKD